MGIRFVCPNGHKLNVKAFLAGKRGICPDCNAKFIVPELSGGLAIPVGPTVGLPKPASAPIQASKVSTSVSPPPVAPLDTLPPAIDQSLPDSWYVRPVSGEQYGPVNTELMQLWVAEGRVTEDSWVWHTGWDRWKIAREVLETLRPTPALEVPAVPTDLITPGVPGVQIDQHYSNKPISPNLRKPITSNRKERARRVSVALGTLVLLLAIVLVLVLWYQS